MPSERRPDLMPMPVLIFDLTQLSLGEKVQSVCRQLNVSTVGQLANCTLEEVKACKGCGVQTLSHIRRLLNCFKLKLQGDEQHA